MTDDTCRIPRGVPPGGIIRDEPECGRPATRHIYEPAPGWMLVASVCPRHAVWYAKHGYQVKQLLPA